jgi:hypothetical protein
MSMGRYGIDWNNRKTLDDFTEGELHTIFDETSKIIEDRPLRSP